ncbi:MAG: DUF3489 domain-containing protein [Usitatibacteraceae bacterium]
MSTSAKKHVTPKQSKKTKIQSTPRVATKIGSPGPKSTKIQQLLGRTSGATIKELAAATGWQEHSVRGFMSGTLKKKLGFAVSSEIYDGARHYKISGTGVTK